MNQVLIKINSKMNDKYLSSLDFNSFTRLLREHEILKLGKLFIENSKEKINSRIFLTSYLVYYHHEIVLSKEKNELEKIVYNQAIQLINLIRNDDTKPWKIKLNLKKWNKSFEYWKNMDKHDLLQQLAKYHKEVRNMNQEKHLLSKIEMLGKQIGGEEGMNHVKTSSKYGMIDNEIILHQVGLQMRNAFWDIFKKDLELDPPNFKQFPDILIDLKEAFIEIIPKKLKQLTINKLNEIIDEKDTIVKIKNKTYNLQNIYEVLSGCLQLLETLHNSDSIKKINKLQSDLDNNIRNKKISEYLPNILRFILEEIEIIKNLSKIYKR